VRFAIAAATIPIAILTNAMRVAGTGIAAYYIGPEAAQGFFHEFSGWIVFLFAFAMILVVQRIIFWIAPPPGVRVARVPAPVIPAGAVGETRRTP
jgi:lipoprotein signal peptidase